ncbi:MAG: sigma-70 family RNA polymerase sigma factor [Thermoanaerobaculia bacterium]|nr:sigma-70 family RNA polymerase sigma factor [Thermoanaerobaculia bacterium]
MPEQAGEVTRLLEDWRRGDEAALAALMSLVHGRLKRLAAAQMRGERPGHTLQPTALVNEAYLRLLGQRRVDWKNRAHFFAVAARMMRRVLLDHARALQRKKRGGGLRAITLAEGLVAPDAPEVDLVELHRALERLGALDPRQERVVELRFFGGLTVEETAEALRISPATVKREWGTAKRWLYRELARGGER